MEQDDCWKTFFASGRVTDYLHYKQQQNRTEDRDAGNNQEIASAPGDQSKIRKVTEHTNAGFY